MFSGAKVHVPLEVVELAEARLAATRANLVVAIGGGSPIGLGKALKLRAADGGRTLRFVAIPTTYAGSENTNIFGITRGRDKQTGRDDRVRPDIVIYDAELTLDLPIALTVQSLCNAIAHVASVLSTSSVADASTAARHARTVIDIIQALLARPRDRDARRDALVHASACARMLDGGKPGAQHAFAHLLGGAFGIDHAALHSILLPRFLERFTDVRDAIATSTSMATSASGPIARLDEHLLALLARAGAPTTLRELGITREALDAVLATRAELPGDIARAAL